MIASLIKIMLAVAAALLTGKLVSRLKLPSILGWLLAGSAGGTPWPEADGQRDP